MSKTQRAPAIHRRRGLIKKGLFTLLTVLLVFSVTSMIASAVIFRVLFPRRDGLSPLHYTYAELDAEAYPREEFAFTSDDHILHGYRYLAKAPVGSVVIVNGIFDGADAHLPEIMFFVDHGWSVVTWDATGIGRSEGRGAIGLQQIKQDLCAYLSSPQASGELPIVLYGHSAGAYAALTALSEGYPIDAVVSISGFNSPTDLMRIQAKSHVGILADVEYPFMLLECLFLFGEDANPKAIDSINAVQTPILIVEGNSDNYISRDLGLLQFDGCFQNPNVRCMEILSDWRNEHATPWLTEQAAEYVCTYSGQSPPDKRLANTLDLEFMDAILAFFLQTTSKSGDLP